MIAIVSIYYSKYNHGLAICRFDSCSTSKLRPR
nr:MAG TPA: hypothetical protein [Caudoviricetes sp.]